MRIIAAISFLFIYCSSFSQSKKVNVRDCLFKSLRWYKVSQNESFYVIGEGTAIMHFHYIDEGLLLKKDSLFEAARKKSVDLFASLKEPLNNCSINLDGITIAHFYFNRQFQGIGTPVACKIDMEKGKITGFEETPSEVQFVFNGYFDAELGRQLKKYKLLDNQYIAVDKENNKALCIVNLVEDINKPEWSVQSKSVYNQFKQAVKRLPYYTSIKIRYENRFNDSEHKDYSFNWQP